MIACLGRNDRGGPLFRALAGLDPRFVDLGVVESSRKSHLAGLVRSAGPNLAETKREARFSPPFLDGLAEAYAERLAAAKEPVEAALSWGATNLPTPAGSKTPFYVVTDGPFDPDDPSYPVEWRPKRWGRTYLARQREVFERAAHVFTLSEWARRKVIDVHGQSPDKVTKCGWGPLACFYPPRLEANEGTKLIVSVGSDWRRKGMDLVIEAGAELHREDPTVQTVIAGVPGDLSLRPRAGVSLLPINTPAPVVHTLMRAANVTVVAARFDASPHVIYESLQYGTPVVGADVCGIPEAVDAPHGGAIAARGDVKGLTDALRRSLDGGEAGRREAYAVFERSGGWERSAEIVREKIALGGRH